MKEEASLGRKFYLPIFLFIVFFRLAPNLHSWQKPGFPPPVSYNIRVILDPEKAMITGEEEITWENRSGDEVSDMLFHLYWNAFKNEASVFFQEARAETRLIAVRPREGKWGWIDLEAIRLADGRDLHPTLTFVYEEDSSPADETVARVIFPEPVKPGQKVNLIISFKAKVPGQGVRTGYRGKAFFISQWFPKPGVYESGKGWNCHPYHLNSEFFADFARFRVAITTPAGYVVGASGKEISRTAEPATRQQTIIFSEEWIHDFSWTAAPDYHRFEVDFIAAAEIQEKELMAWAEFLGLKPEEVRLPDIKMIILLRPEHVGQLDRHTKALKQAIKYYGLWFGPYPYEQITLVDPPYGTGSGGMEYPTLFTAGTPLFLNRDVLSPEGVIIHEFGHNYWYGLVANNEFEEAWLDEGINTYSTGRVLARAYGPGVLSFSIYDLPLAWFFRLPRYYDWELDRATCLPIVSVDPVLLESWKFLNRLSYGINVYQRASTCLLTLEKLIGEKKMLLALREFQRRFRFRHPRSQDFFAIMSEVSGYNLNWFFDTFLLSTKTFDYGIGALRSRPKPARLKGVFGEGDQKVEVKSKEDLSLPKQDTKPEVYITEVIVRRYGEARTSPEFPLLVKIGFEDGSEEVRTWDGQERWKRFRLEKPVRAEWAAVDPDHVWIIDANWANNSLRLKETRKGILRASASLFFFLQNILMFLSGLI